MTKRKRYQYLGWIIEKGAFTWAVLDWDYEGERVAYVARSEHEALAWADRNS